MSVDIDHDAAAHVMGRRNHRNRLLGHIESEIKTSLVNIWEAFAAPVPFNMRHVQIDTILAALFHFKINGPRHNIPGSQAPHRMIFFHECLTVLPA